MKGQTTSKLVAIALCSAVFAAAGQTLTAGGDVITWPTYLRAGPGRGAAVIGELARDEPVVVRDCVRGWCRIEVDRVLGYVERGRLGSPAALASADDRSACFDSRRAGYKGGQPLRFCPRAAGAAPTALGASAAANVGR